MKPNILLRMLQGQIIPLPPRIVGGYLHFSTLSLASGGAGMLCSLRDELVGGADWPAGSGCLLLFVFSAPPPHAFRMCICVHPAQLLLTGFVSLPKVKSILVQLCRWFSGQYAHMYYVTHVCTLLFQMWVRGNCRQGEPCILNQ